MIRVHLDANCERFVDVPLTPNTSCADVINCCCAPDDGDCYLVELWHGCGTLIHSLFLLTGC